METRVQTISSFENISFWEVSHKILKKKPKDFFNTLKTTIELAEKIFPKLKTMNALNAFLDNVKCWIDHFILHETADKFLELRKAIAAYANKPSKDISVNKKENSTISKIEKLKSYIKQTASLRVPVLDFIYKTTKLTTWASTNNIVVFGATFLKRFGFTGGVSFALSSVQQFASECNHFNEIKTNYYLEQTSSVYKMSRCIGTLAMGVFGALKALGYFISPSILLFFATMIIVTTISSEFLEGIAKEAKDLHDKQEQMQKHWINRFFSLVK